MAMNKKTGLSRRGLIRLISYTLAVIVALTAGTIGGYTAAKRHRATIEYGYQRALGELTEYLGNLDITLEKGKYAATSGQLQGLSAKLWREAGYAKGVLGQLPISGSELSGTYKFLSQVGDFCMVLSNRVAQGGTVTKEEANTLRELADYSHEIYTKVAEMQNAAAAGLLSFAEAADAVRAEAPALNDGFHDMEEGFEDYPTLIYDGPFSDHIQQQQPKFLQDKLVVTQEQAAGQASTWAGRALEAVGESSGHLPCYQFAADNFSLTVTKAGGYVAYLLDSRPIGEAALTLEEALEKGDQFLKDRQMDGFVQSYYSLNNGVLTINYAYQVQDVVFYPDLVKVGIAMDNGQVVAYDAAGFLMNHTDRKLPDVRITAEEARSRLSPLLEPEGAPRLTVIPDTGLSETLCYEFACAGEDGEQVLVYIGTDSGVEEQILILLEDETGTLVM